MIEAAISRRYAKALIELAQESKQLDAVSQQVLALENMCEAQPQLVFVLGNRFIDQNERIKAMEAVAGKLGLTHDVKGLLRLLIKRGRVALLSMICREFRQMAMGINNQVEARIISAVKLDDAVTEEIRKLLSQKGPEVLVKNEVDARVLGGIRVVMGNDVYDATVQAELDKMAEAMRSARI